MSNIKIVVVDRGWVFIGNVFKSAESTSIKNCHVIRRWGTSEGLGELCIKGKLDKTILDKCLDVEIPLKSIIAYLDCDQEKWNNLL
jgi:hypothetical protein